MSDFFEQFEKFLAQQYMMQEEYKAAGKIFLFMVGFVSECSLNPRFEIEKEGDKVLIKLHTQGGTEVLVTSVGELSEPTGCRELLSRFVKAHSAAHTNPINKHSVCNFN